MTCLGKWTFGETSNTFVLMHTIPLVTTVFFYSACLSLPCSLWFVGSPPTLLASSWPGPYRVGCFKPYIAVAIKHLRNITGIGAAFTIPSAQAHIAVCFPEPAKKAQALGFWGVSGSLGFM